MLMLALRVYETELCGGCGHPRSEAWDASHDPADPENDVVYATGAPYRCLACTSLENGKKDYMKQLGDDTDYAAGTYWITELVHRR